MDIEDSVVLNSKSTAMLLHHNASCITVVDLPLNFLKTKDNVISVKSLMKEIIPPSSSSKRKEKTDIEKSPVASENIENVNNFESNSSSNNINNSSSIVNSSKITKPSVGRGMNYFTSFIEDMERRYTAHHTTVGSNSDLSDANSDCESNVNSSDGSEDSEEEGGEINKMKKTKGGPKQKRHDFYDMDDVDSSDGENFNIIDDSELGHEVDEALYSHYSKTKHQGFFVSSGELEVLPPPQLMVNKGGRPPTKSIPNLGSLDNDISIASLKRKRTSSSKESGSNRKSAPPPLPLELLDLPPVDVTNILVSVRNPPPQPELQPQPHITSPTEDGVDQVTNLISKKVKKLRPLWEPNTEVIRAFGVFKAQCIALGCESIAPNIGIPRILEEPLQVLDNVVQQNHAIELKRQTGYFESICEVLGGHVTTSKVKTLFGRMASKDAAEKARSSMEDIIAKLIKDIRNATLPLHQKSLSSGVNGEVVDDDDMSISSKISGGSSSPTRSKSDKFLWYCKWTPSMRSSLFSLERFANMYVETENKKRKGLTMEEKRSEGIDGKPDLDSTIYFNQILTRLVKESFPEEACKGADLISLKKIITTERNKRTKANQEMHTKTMDLKHNILSNSGSSSSATHKKVPQMVKHPRLSRDFVNIKDFDGDDFVEKQSNLGGGIAQF
jgi:hypothetical protein